MKPKRRPPIKTIEVLLRGEQQINYLEKVIPNLPLDPDRPIQVLIREEPKKRKITMNDAMWAGPLRDFAEQAWTNQRQYSAEVWHEGFKRLLLPDPDEFDFDPSHVVDPETYRKWDVDPVTNERVCVGSTTQLTDKGMGFYLDRMCAIGAQNYGVQFTERAEPMGRVALCKALRTPEYEQFATAADVMRRLGGE